MWDDPIPLNHYKPDQSEPLPDDPEEMTEEQVAQWEREVKKHLENRVWIPSQFSPLEDIARQLDENSIRQNELNELSYALMHHGHNSMRFVDKFLKNSKFRTLISLVGFSSRRTEYMGEFLSRAKQEAHGIYVDRNEKVDYRAAALNFLIAARIDCDPMIQRPWPEDGNPQKRELNEAWQKSKKDVESFILFYHLGSKKVLKEVQRLSNYEEIATALLKLHWDDVNAYRIYKKFETSKEYKELEKEIGKKNQDFTRKIGEQLFGFDSEWGDIYPSNLSYKLPFHTQRLINALALEYNGPEHSIIMRAADNTPESDQHSTSERLRLSKDFKNNWAKKSK